LRTGTTHAREHVDTLHLSTREREKDRERERREERRGEKHTYTDRQTDRQTAIHSITYRKILRVRHDLFDILEQLHVCSGHRIPVGSKAMDGTVLKSSHDLHQTVEVVQLFQVLCDFDEHGDDSNLRRKRRRTKPGCEQNSEMKKTSVNI
jgi:sRNA-binding protein